MNTTILPPEFDAAAQHYSCLLINLVEITPAVYKQEAYSPDELHSDPAKADHIT